MTVTDSAAAPSSSFSRAPSPDTVTSPRLLPPRASTWLSFPLSTRVAPVTVTLLRMVSLPPAPGVMSRSPVMVTSRRVTPGAAMRVTAPLWLSVYTPAAS